MYEHKVVKCCPSFGYPISRAHKFHASFDDIRDAMFPMYIDQDELNFDLMSEIALKYAYPPYRLCWFDGDLLGNRVGMLVHQDFKDSRSREGVSLYFFMEEAPGEWYSSPISIYLYISDTVVDRIPDESNLHNVGKHVCFERCNLIESDEEEELFYSTGLSLMIQDMEYALLDMLIILNIKGATIKENIPAPLKLNKKRGLNGNGEIFSYHTVKVNVPAITTHYNSPSGNGTTKRLHWRRAHLKRYVKPLFNRTHVGLVFCPAALVGKNRCGAVIKDYDVLTAKEGLNYEKRG